MSKAMMKDPILYKTQNFDKQQQNKHKQTPIKDSPHYQTYLELMDQMIGQKQSNFSQQQLLQKLKKAGFKYQPNHNKTKIVILQRSTQRNCFKFGVSIGPFYRETTMINVQTTFKSKDAVQLGKGSFGTVFYLSIDAKNYAIKSFTNKQHKLISIVIQHAFYSIAAALGFGPQLMSTSFDLYYFPDRIQFVMEQCIPINKNQAKIDEAISQIARDLKSLHMIGIVHRDIKPENMMYSQNHQKYVLIDFGMATILKQKVSELTETSFIGTYRYCCKQMKQLYLSKQKGLIDLYYNDYYCLKTTSNILKQQILQSQFQNLNTICYSMNKNPHENIQELIYICSSFMNGLFCLKIEQLKHLIEKYSEIQPFFYYIFLKFCDHQFRIQPSKHLYYTLFSQKKTENQKNQQKNMLLKKIFDSISNNFSQKIMNDISTMLDSDNRNSKNILYEKAQLKKLSDLRKTVIQFEIEEQHGQDLLFFQECLLVLLHDYPDQFDRHQKQKWIDKAILILIPEQKQSLFPRKLYKIYQKFRFTFQQVKNINFLMKIRLYYLIMYYSQQYLEIQLFIINECLSQQKQILKEINLNMFFMIQRNSTQICCDKFNQLIVQYKQAKQNDDEQTTYLRKILISIYELYSNLQVKDDYIKKIQGFINQILDIDKLFDSDFKFKMKDVLHIMTFILMQQQKLPTSIYWDYIQNISVYFYNIKRISLGNILRIDLSVHNNSLIMFIQPIQLLQIYLQQNMIQYSLELTKGYFEIQRPYISQYQNLQTVFSRWLHNNQYCLQIWRMQSENLFNYLSRYVSDQASFYGSSIQKNLIISIFRHVTLFLGIDNQFFNGQIIDQQNEKWFKSEMMSRIQKILQYCEINDANHRILLEITDQLLVSQKQLVIKKLISLYQQKGQRLYLEFICLLWNTLQQNSAIQIEYRNFIIDKLQKQTVYNVKKTQSGIPIMIVCKVLIRQKQFVWYLKVFKTYFTETNSREYQLLQISYYLYFSSISKNQLISLAHHIFQNCSLNRLRQHATLGFYYTNIFFHTYQVLNQHQIKRLLIICYICLHTGHNSPINLIHIAHNLCLIQNKVFRHTNYRKRLGQIRNLARKGYNQKLVQRLSRKINLKKFRKIRTQFSLKIKSLEANDNQLQCTFTPLYKAMQCRI